MTVIRDVPLPMVARAFGMTPAQLNRWVAQRLVHPAYEQPRKGRVHTLSRDVAMNVGIIAGLADVGVMPSAAGLLLTAVKSGNGEVSYPDGWASLSVNLTFINSKLVELFGDRQ